MDPRHRRRLGVLLVGVALLFASLDAVPASGNPLDDKREEARQLAAKIDALGEQVSVLTEQFNEARIHSERVEREVAIAKARAEETARRVETAKARVRGRAVGAYVGGGAVSQTAALLRANGTDLVLRNAYMATAVGNDRLVLDALRAARADLQDRQRALAKDQEAARKATLNLAASRDAAARAADSQRALLAKVQGELNSLVQQEQARLAAEAAQRAQAELAARQAREAQMAAAQRASRSRGGPGSADASDGGAGGSARPGGWASRSTFVSPRPVAASGGASAAISFAQAQLGKPYVWGGTGPHGYDCSGLTMMAWRQGGISLSHSAADQYASTSQVPISQVQPGDLVFYGGPIHHVGIYVGNGMMIDAPHTGAVVRYSSIYRGGLVGVGRPG